MGTSASNGGPKGRTPLLPDWYNPEKDQPAPPQKNPDEEGSPENTDLDKPQTDQENEKMPEKEILKVSGNWSIGKGALTRLANRTAGSSLKKASKGYVKSMGGAKAATAAARMGVITGSRFASFLGSVSTQGFEAALGQIGITDLVGKSSDEIMLNISEALSPTGSTTDEAVAREALISTMDFIYTQLLDEGKDLSELSNFTPEMVKDTLIEYVSCYIFNKWMYQLGIAIEKGDLNISQTIKLESDIREYVKLEVISAYADKKIDPINLKAEQNQLVIKNILLTAYSTLEK